MTYQFRSWLKRKTYSESTHIQLRAACTLEIVLTSFVFKWSFQSWNNLNGGSFYQNKVLFNSPLKYIPQKVNHFNWRHQWFSQALVLFNWWPKPRLKILFQIKSWLKQEAILCESTYEPNSINSSTQVRWYSGKNAFLGNNSPQISTNAENTPDQ